MNSELLLLITFLVLALASAIWLIVMNTKAQKPQEDVLHSITIRVCSFFLIFILLDIPFNAYANLSFKKVAKNHPEYIFSKDNTYAIDNDNILYSVDIQTNFWGKVEEIVLTPGTEKEPTEDTIYLREDTAEINGEVDTSVLEENAEKTTETETVSNTETE